MRDDETMQDVSDDDEEQELEQKPPKSLLDALVRNRDDLLRLRIKMGNRIAACRRSGWDEGLLTSLTSSMPFVESAEADADKTIKRLVKKHPVWQAWLSQVRGVGESLAAPLLEYLDPEVPHLSCWYRYVGLYCDDAGDAVRKRKNEKAAYSHYLKTHLVFKIGSSFIKTGGFYRDEYDRVKAKLAEMPPVRREIARAKLWVLAEDVGKVKAGNLLDSKTYVKVKADCERRGEVMVSVRRRPLHMHQMARRAAVKLFMAHLYQKWREVLGLPYDPPYAHAILGHTGYIGPERAVGVRVAE